MAIKDLLALSAKELKDLEGRELRQSFNTFRDVLRKRRQTFEKHGKLSGMPARYQHGIKRSSDFDTDAEMRAYLMEGLAYMRGKVSTYKGYKEAQDSRREAYEKSTGRKFGSEAEFNRFGNFMGEMAERLGAQWKAVSSQIRELYDEAERLNLKPDSLIRNFEYWAEHLEDLQNADPIEKRSRDLRPSDYLKKLKLESINSFYESSDREDPHEYSRKARKPSRGRAYRKGRTGK